MVSYYADQLFNHLVCRPALPLDTKDMLELTSQIWEGDDYVPKVWHDWLFDPDGLFAAAVLKGKVVGLGKLTKLSPQDWWLEGLRVHPRFEARGIASHIHRYLLDYWEQTGTGMIRFATVSTREPVKHLAEATGFRIVGEYSTFASSTSRSHFEKSFPFTLIKEEEIGKVNEWFASNYAECLNFGLMNLGWQFAPPHKDFIAEYLVEKKLWWWKQDRGILLLVEKKDGLDTWGRIQQLVCAFEDISELLSDTYWLADRFAYRGITWIGPLIPGIEGKTSEAGFQRDWDSSLLVYEKSYTRKQDN